MIFSICIGTGIQILAMVFIVILFCFFGMRFTNHRGMILSSFYVMMILLSFVSGFYSARFYKMFGGSDWLVCTLGVSLAYPSFLFGLILIINLANWMETSSSTIPFSTFIKMILLYIALSVPNVWIGAFFGFKMEKIYVNVPELIHFVAACESE